MLTCQLLPLLYKNAPRARIVNVVSFTHRCGTYNVLAQTAGHVSALKNCSLCYELPKLWLCDLQCEACRWMRVDWCKALSRHLLTMGIGIALQESMRHPNVGHLSLWVLCSCHYLIFRFRHNKLDSNIELLCEVTTLSASDFFSWLDWTVDLHSVYAALFIWASSSSPLQGSSVTYLCHVCSLLWNLLLPYISYPLSCHSSVNQGTTEL